MCSGRLFAALGREQCPDQTIKVFSDFAMSCLTQDSDSKLELRETALSYFGDLAILLKEDINPIANQVLD